MEALPNKFGFLSSDTLSKVRYGRVVSTSLHPLPPVEMINYEEDDYIPYGLAWALKLLPALNLDLLIVLARKGNWEDDYNT